MRYISELREGETIIEHYYCKMKQSLKSAKTGKNYISMKLQDKTGMADAKIWDMNNAIQSFEEGDFIKIEAVVTSFNNEIQLNIKKLRRSMEGEYDPSDYVPSTDKDIDKLFNEFISYIDTIKNKYIKTLLQNIFMDSHIATAFKTHSAAKAMHHSFLGGLLEHSLSVTKVCDFLAKHYEGVNRDILVASAMLHDICKIYELSDFPENDYTDEGQLLGHIVMCSELITEQCGKINSFPTELKNLLKHCILAHHGVLEYGSPKEPAIKEAYLLHCADDMDAKTQMYKEMIEKDATQGRWVGFNKMLGRNIRKSDFE